MQLEAPQCSEHPGLRSERQASGVSSDKTIKSRAPQASADTARRTRRHSRVALRLTIMCGIPSFSGEEAGSSPLP